MKSKIALIIISLAFAVFTGCGDDNSGDGPIDSNGDRDQDISENDTQPVEGDADQDEEPADTEEADDYEVTTVPETCGENDDGIILRTVRGKVIDENGDPLAEVAAIVCTLAPDNHSACMTPVRTGDDGVYTARVNTANECVVEAAIRFADTQNMQRTIPACPIEIGAGGSMLLDDPVKLVEIPVASRDPEGDASQPHDIWTSDGTTLTIIPENISLFQASYDAVQLMTWDADTYGWPCFIDANDPPDILVALVPELTVNAGKDNAAHMSFPNTPGFDAGEVLDLYGLGGLSTYDWDNNDVHEGDFAVIGTATVSQDGTAITTDGKGLPFLTWVGIKQQAE